MCGYESCSVGVSTLHTRKGSAPSVCVHEASSQEHEVLRIKEAAYVYPRAVKPVFQGVNLAIEKGKVLAILGNNGAGKSTLLDVVAGLLRPAAGAVCVGNRNLASLSRRETARCIAYVAQQQKIPHVSVYDQVLLGRRPHITWALSDYDRAVVFEVIERMGLQQFTTRYLDELSGGERQKVYIARALAQEPEVLLLDEPTSALDLKNQMGVLEIVRQITHQGSLATVLVIHDVNLALRFCDCFLLMRDGCVIAQGGHEVATAENLSITYDLEVCLETIGGIPVAVPVP
ncbi:MAG: ABC transporter ATP-binding protein [Raoultibacter sp.]